MKQQLRRLFRAGAGMLLATMVWAAPLQAQHHRSKLPLLGKLTSNTRQQAYSGTIQSLDFKQRIMNVNSRRGHDTEIFPLKKDIRVETINGKRMKLKSLTPGTKVLIYYDQKHGKRTVKYIVVLEDGKEGAAPSQHPAG